jgi:KDO2-lipid IV(A) lauroyltransferase
MPEALTMKYKPAHVIEYLLVVSLGGLMRILPLRMALSLGWIVAVLSHYVGHVHVERTRQRVRQVLGTDASEKDVRRIAWLAWRNLCFNAVEGFRFIKLTAKKIRELPLASLEEDLKRIQNDCSAGFILATPHMGNWEIAGIAGDLIGLPLFVIVRKQKNPLLDAYINKMRRTFSLEVLHRESKIWKGVADRIKQGKILAILPDINSRRKGITVDFLNNKATIAPGAALFAQLGNCPIYPILVRRIGWTRHDAVLLDPIFPDPEADRDEDQHRIMQEIMTAFTNEILKTPEQYFWHNKRWVLDS